MAETNMGRRSLTPTLVGRALSIFLKLIPVTAPLVVALKNDDQHKTRRRGDRPDERDDQADDKPHGSSAVIVQVPQALLDEYRANREQDKAEEEKRARLERKRLRIEFGALIFLVLGAVVAFVTLVFVNQSTRAATNAANAASGALAISQHSERAWLLFQSATMLSPITAGAPMTAEYVFKNTGRTPALGVLSAAQFHVLKGEGEPEPTVQFDMRTVRRDIGAGETYIARTGRILSDEEWTHLRAGTHVLFLFGAIQYMDVFKLPISQTTVPNYSNFCAQYVMDSTGVGILRPVKCRIEIR